MAQAVRLAVLLGIVVAAAFDTATFYRLPLMDAGELNPVVLYLGPLAVISKLLLAAGIIVAVRHRGRYAVPVGAFATATWGLGAFVNGM